MNRQYIVILILLSAQNSNSAPQCNVPQYSRWNQSLQQLTASTENIVVTELTSHKDVSETSDIKADFKPSMGIAADGRRDPSGKMRPLNLQGNVRWNFKIQKTLKGNLKNNEILSFVSLKREDESTPQLTSILCNYGLNFKVNSKYLIFVNSYNPNGYQQVKDLNDPKIKEIERLLKQ